MVGFLGCNANWVGRVWLFGQERGRLTLWIAGRVVQWLKQGDCDLGLYLAHAAGWERDGVVGTKDWESTKGQQEGEGSGSVRSKE